MTRNWLPIRTNPWTLGLPLLLMLWLLNAFDVPQRLNFWTYDTLITSFPGEMRPDIALVAIDEKSLDLLGRWPWSRAVHGRLIDKLEAAGARTIVLDILFAEPTPDDSSLASAMRAHGGVILPLHLSPASGPLLTTHLPAPELAEAAAELGHTHVALDRDGIARGTYLRSGLGNRLWPSLALATAGGSLVADTDLQAAPYVNIRQGYRAVPLAGPAGSVTTYSYADVLSAPPSPDRFRNKTIFVGATAAGLGDILPTPFAGSGQPLSGVEFHANAYSALADNTLISRAPLGLSLLLAAAALVALVLTLPRVWPGQAFGLCLLLAFSLLAAQATLLVTANLWLSVAHAVIIAILAIPVSTALRLAMANRFLNRQLDELALGPAVALPSPAARHPEQLMSDFRALLQPRSWLLAKDEQTVHGEGLSLCEAPELESPGHWVHRNNESWVRIDRDGQHYTLGLRFANDLNREAVQRYLQKLHLAEPDTRAPDSHPREKMSAQIERVRKATAQMSQMQQFIHRSFESMPDGIIITDELGVIRFANSHIKAWFGEPTPSLNGLPLARLLDGHDPRESAPWHETVSETLTLAQARTVDLQLASKAFLIHFAPFALPGSDQSGIIANVSDVSERWEQQRQHREAIDFISHDVRSPLVSQLALIEQLKRHQGQIESGQLDQLGKLARRSYHLAEEFVQLARAEQLTETRFYECEFLAIVENARDSVIEQAAEKDIQLVLSGEEELWLKGNAELLERAVINLITNAVQYSPSGSVVTAQVFSAGHEACLTIADEGEGIAEHELPHLFSPYWRQRSNELSGNHGTGLGLSFVAVVTEKHHGVIAVDSRLGEGSAFRLRLPMITRVNNS